jgi:hypothetical protein
MSRVEQPGGGDRAGGFVAMDAGEEPDADRVMRRRGTGEEVSLEGRALLQALVP